MKTKADFSIAACMTLLAVTALFPAPAHAASPAIPLAQPVWLCKPGMPRNPCNQTEDGTPQRPDASALYPSGAKVPLNATVFQGEAASGIESFAPQGTPKVDCFYVYPTVDLLTNPLWAPGSNPPVARPEHVAMMLAQAGRLTSLCRMFAPLYRQSTLLQIAQSISRGTAPYPGPGFTDVRQAWDDYWAHDNVDAATGRRRGVILLGHSQGSVALAQLILQRFDGNPNATRQLVSAVLLGGRIMVPAGAATGGGNDADATFQHLPLCERPAGAPLPTGCVVAYSAFMQKAGGIPASGSMGESSVPGHRIACVNPGALLQGTGAQATTPLDAYLPTRKLVLGKLLNPNGQLSLILTGFKLPNLGTGFARYPARLTGACQSATNGQASVNWLQIEGGQGLFPESAESDTLGLHVFDYNVALGTLASLLAAQSASWLEMQGAQQVGARP